MISQWHSWIVYNVILSLWHATLPCTRCPPVLEILLRVLAAYTAASKAWLQEHAHTQNCVAMATPEPVTPSSSGHMTKAERDELCVALTAAQESAIIQLLLEICLPTEEDKEVWCWVCWVFVFPLFKQIGRFWEPGPLSSSLPFLSPTSSSSFPSSSLLPFSSSLLVLLCCSYLLLILLFLLLVPIFFLFPHHSFSPFCSLPRQRPHLVLSWVHYVKSAVWCVPTYTRCS